MKKLILLSTIILSLTACGMQSNTDKDNAITIEAGNTLAGNQPTPTDLDYSLERYNLIRRAYWVNGLKEKARTVTRPAEVPLGYCILLSYTGQVVGQFQVDGKVTSLNSYLTADYYYKSGSDKQYPLPDVDGSYGSNDDGIFFFTPQWQYIEWNGNYLYSDTLFRVQETVIGEY